jgi:hypothetical protein
MILKKLEALANRLDRLKLTKEADLTDSILTSLVKAAQGLPHDDDDEEMFENYLSNLDNRDDDTEELEQGDMTSDELRVQLDAITKMLTDDRLSETEKKMLASDLQNLRLELGNEQQGWGMGGSIIGDSEVLPVAEASKR